MAFPDPPVILVDWGSVAAAAETSVDWGSVAQSAEVFVDWENTTGPSIITGLTAVTLPVDKMWAHVGEIERRKDDEVY